MTEVRIFCFILSAVHTDKLRARGSPMLAGNAHKGIVQGKIDMRGNIIIYYYY